MRTEKSHALYKRANKRMVGGVNSGARAFNAVGGNPLFMKKGKGPYIYDADENGYLDFVGSFGPLILGHCHEEVTQKVKEAVDQGTSFGASTEPEVALAEMIHEAIPSIEKVRFVNSGTEAALTGVRLARAYTGRNKVIKFAGCYHGHVDSLLVQAGSGVATQGMPGSEGIPESYTQDTLVAEFNDIESVRQIFKQYPDEIAGIFLEPVTGNMGVVNPDASFLNELRSLASEYGALLVFDEVMTGFRYHFGGAQDALQVTPDLTLLGKVIGGGMPVGAVGGPARIMDKLSPVGGVYQGGTLSGNPIAMTAGYYTLKTLKENQALYDHLHEMGYKLEKGIKEISEESKVPVQVHRFGSMINPFFSENPIRNFTDAKGCNTEQFKTFFWELAEKGVWIPPSQFESWFLSTALTKDHIDQTLEAIREAFDEVAKVPASTT